MRILFFILLKLIEIAAVVVAISIAVVLAHFAPEILLYICLSVILLFVLGVLIYANWKFAEVWAEAWRKRKLDKKLKRAQKGHGYDTS